MNSEDSQSRNEENFEESGPQTLRTKQALYDSLKDIYFLPRINTNAITIESLKNVKNADYFCLIQKQMLKNHKHDKCKSKLFGLKQIDKVLKEKVYQKTQKHLFSWGFGVADESWYCVFTKNFDIELHNQIYHGTKPEVELIGYNGLPIEGFVRSNSKIGPFQAGDRNQNEIVYKETKSHRKMIKNKKIATVNFKTPVENAIEDMTKKVKKDLKAEFNFEDKNGTTMKNNKEAAELLANKIIHTYMHDADDVEKNILNEEINKMNTIQSDFYFREKGLLNQNYEIVFQENEVSVDAIAALRRQGTNANSDQQLIMFFGSYMEIHKASFENFVYGSASQKEIIVTILKHAPETEMIPFYVLIKPIILANLQAHPRLVSIKREIDAFITKDVLIRFCNTKLHGFPSIVPESMMIDRITNLFHFVLAKFATKYLINQDTEINEEFLEIVTKRATNSEMKAFIIRKLENIDNRLSADVIKNQYFTAIINIKVIAAMNNNRQLASDKFKRRFDSVSVGYMRWNEMVDSKYNKKIGRILKLFCPRAEIIRDLHIETERQLFSALIQTLYMMTFTSYKTPLVYSFLSYLLTRITRETMCATTDQIKTILNMVTQPYLSEDQKNYVSAVKMLFVSDETEDIANGIFIDQITKNNSLRELAIYLGDPPSQSITELGTILAEIKCIIIRTYLHP